MNAIEEMCKSILCLYLEAPAEVMKGVEAKWKDVLFVLDRLRNLLQQVYEQTENGYRVKTLTRIEIKKRLDNFFEGGWKMTAERKTEVNGHRVEEYYWAGKMVVYIDNFSTEETYKEAVKRLRREVKEDAKLQE